MSNVLIRWHQLVKDQDHSALDSLLAEDVVFYSPVVHTPQRGKSITMKYLTAACHVFFNGSFHYVREIVGDHQALLEFEVEIDGILVNGADIICWNEDDQITLFKVMVRPRKALEIVASNMMAMLQSMGTESFVAT